MNRDSCTYCEGNIQNDKIYLSIENKPYCEVCYKNLLEEEWVKVFYIKDFKDLESVLFSTKKSMEILRLWKNERSVSYISKCIKINPRVVWLKLYEFWEEGKIDNIEKAFLNGTLKCDHNAK